MNNAIQAIRTEKQISSIYLEQLQTCLDAKKDYLSKVEINFIIFLIYKILY